MSGAPDIRDAATTAVAPSGLTAGFGCRKGASAADIRAALESALRSAGRPLSAVTLLAAPRLKAHEAGLIAAAADLGLPLAIVPDAALTAAAGRTLSRSDRVAALIGVPSAAEAAALGAAGAGSTLIGPRIKTPRATCALAMAADPEAGA